MNRLFSPEAISDPYSYFGRLRSQDPVHWDEENQLWLITRYDDCVWLARHPELFSNAVYLRDRREPYPPIQQSHLGLYQFLKGFFASWLAEFDPPEHTQMRAVIYDYFTPRAVERWRPLVRQTIGRLLDQVGTRMDLLHQFAMPLPVFIIAEMLGIPAQDRELVQSLSQKILLYNRGESDRMTDLVEGIQAFQAYLRPLAAERLARPGEDLLSVLLSGESRGVYSREQVVANAILLLFAGHETTMNLICNGVLALMRHPEEWRRFRAAPGQLVKSLTEECLRYDPPVKSIGRIALQDVELRGRHIRADDRIRYVISSANRDPQEFENPDSFQVQRRRNPHIAFGVGAHYCVGSTLGRLEGQEAFLALAERFGSFELECEQVEYIPGITFRSLVSMPVSWRH